MEVVLLLVALIGIALIALPRVQASRRRRARVVTRAAVSTPVSTSWAPPPGSDEDIWEDDLGWEGEDLTPPNRSPEPSAPAPSAGDIAAARHAASASEVAAPRFVSSNGHAELAPTGF